MRRTRPGRRIDPEVGRMSIQDYFKDRAVVYTVANTTDAAGGRARTVIARIDPLPCRVIPMNGAEIIQRQATGTNATVKLYCGANAGSTITEADEIEIGADWYEVTYVHNPQTMNHHLVVDLRRTKGAGHGH